MSAHLVENRGAIHTFRDDLESSFWVILWTITMYCETSLSVEAHSEFIRQTFKLGGHEKRSVLLLQLVFKVTSNSLPDTPTSNNVVPIPPNTSCYSSDVLTDHGLSLYASNKPTPDSDNLQQPILFPKQPMLHQLLKNLVDLFGALYWTPSPSDLWVVDYAASCPKGDPIQDHLKTLSAYCHQQSISRLQDHQYVINYLVDHLNLETWPTDDKAVPQEITVMEYDVAEKLDKAVVLQSKHICELVEEVERQHKKARLAGGHNKV